MKLEQVMTKDVLMLSPEDPVLEASAQMMKKKASGAPVVDEKGILVGIITEANILRSLKMTKKTIHLIYPSVSSIGVGVAFKEKISEKEILEAFNEMEGIKVGDVMTKEVFSFSPDDQVRDAIKTMISKSINRLPIVDDELKPIGIVTRGDILRGIAEESNNNNSKE